MLEEIERLEKAMAALNAPAEQAQELRVIVDELLIRTHAPELPLPKGLLRNPKVQRFLPYGIHLIAILADLQFLIMVNFYGKG